MTTPYVEVYAKKKLLYRIKDRLGKIRLERPYLMLWAANMYLNGAFVAQGMVGLLTLGLYEPNWTTKPSVYVARQRAECRSLEKPKTQSTVSSDDIYDEWMKQMSGEE